MIQVRKRAVFAPFGSKLMPEFVVTHVSLFGVITLYRARIYRSDIGDV